MCGLQQILDVWLYDTPNRQLKFFRELKITFVMRGHGHDGSGAVAHHDVVGDPDGDLLFVHGVGGKSAGEDAGLFLRQFRALHVGFASCLFSILLNSRELFLCYDLIYKRMLRREHHVCGTKQRIRTCGEYFDCDLNRGTRNDGR